MSTYLDDLKLNQIEELNLSDQDIEPEEVIEIANLLCTNTSLHTLDLSINNIQAEVDVKIKYNFTYIKFGQQ